MANYISYEESLRKEKELYLKLKKERKEINRFTLTGTEAEFLVILWNDCIRRFGVFTLYDLKTLVFDDTVCFTDIKYGWDHEISLKKDFIVSVYHGELDCKLNLPAYKGLD